MKIEMLRWSVSGYHDSSENKLVVEKKGIKRKYFLSEKWFYRFKSLMEESEEKGHFWGPEYFSSSVFRPKKDKEKEVEFLYYEFKRSMVRKNLMRIFLCLLMLVGLVILLITII